MLAPVTRAMTSTRLPSWNEIGVLPPVRPGQSGSSQDRSPYVTTLLDIARSFGTSAERQDILRGLLALRSKLHDMGLREGFQWLDGSFFEHVEMTRGRPPGDIDVVTFVYLGTEENQTAMTEAAPEIFYPPKAKEKYSVDHYVYGLGEPMGHWEVRGVAYWYSMWSHRKKDDLWKGFVEVTLDTAGDAAVLALLNEGP